MTDEEKLRDEQLAVRFERLENKMVAGFNSIDAKFNGIDAKFNGIDAKFNNQRHLMIAMILSVVGQIATALILHKWG
jgi:hypothetical protein